MDSVKQVDEAIAGLQYLKVESFKFGLMGLVGKYAHNIEVLRLHRIAMICRVRKEVFDLQWIAQQAPKMAKWQEMIAQARFVAIKSGHGLAEVLATRKLLRSI